MSITDRYPIEVWPVGPPHEFSPRRNTAKDAICTACGARRDRAIHSESFWLKNDRVPGPFPSATEYVAWRQAYDL